MVQVAVWCPGRQGSSEAEGMSMMRRSLESKERVEGNLETEGGLVQVDELKDNYP